MFRLLCFGYPRLAGPDGRNLEELQSHPKRFAVLIYLACHSEVPVCHRESLLPVFWPMSDESHARNSLRQTIHVLRTMLGRGMVLGGSGGEVRLDLSRLSCDVRLFCKAVRTGALHEALELRTEQFLNDFFVPDADPFMDWVDQRRRTLKGKALDAATFLARKADEDLHPFQAVTWWRRAQALSPYDEGVMVGLAWALAKCGNRGSVLAEYQRFRHRMERDLELRPSSATRVEVSQALRVAGSAHPAHAAAGRRRREMDLVSLEIGAS